MPWLITVVFVGVAFVWVVVLGYVVVCVVFVGVAFVWDMHVPSRRVSVLMIPGLV